MLSRALLLAESRLRERDRHISALKEENALNIFKLKLQAPKVRYFDEVLRSTSTYTVTQIARGLGKTIDFMRAVSLLFLVMNIYYFCYPFSTSWDVPTA